VNARIRLTSHFNLDSSRRAVEAADNVVHAYDMDMHIPDGPPSLATVPSMQSSEDDVGRPEILVAGSNLPISRPNKRRRGDDSISISPSKIAATNNARLARSESNGESFIQTAQGAGVVTPSLTVDGFEDDQLPSPPKSLERSVAPGLRHTQLRNVIQYVVNESLKVGGRPESAVARETETGEMVEVQTRSPTGERRTKFVEWFVDPAVPDTMLGMLSKYNIMP